MVTTDGDAVLLYCSAVANPTASITWLFNSVEVDGVLTNGSLLLSPVQVTDEGNYTCRASNSIGSDEAVVFLSVLVPAVAITGEDNITVVEGQPVNFTCQATGDPQPVITWYVCSWDMVIILELSYIFGNTSFFVLWYCGQV